MRGEKARCVVILATTTVTWLNDYPRRRRWSSLSA
ncbi:hypothetical protein EYF80_067357 [Liparis tanakae]|uniref:Uncharacterized protein n=1 Tax=Liparis tanakae TaxID=230148 RepID=A0A4Z2E1A1_9TELE|nr:hypothetical protein EYF80_067357 [Liparis tanakae]